MTTTQIASGTTTHMQRIRGALGEKALSKSFEFFDQGLFSVLTEVLQNARRAGSSRVAVEIVGTGPQASITVRDDGCGIPAQRLDEAESQGRLGVAQSIKGRIAALGGTVTVTSSPGSA